MSKNWNAPGLIDKKLTRCPDKPNCVCSEYKDDIKHYIEPIYISENIDSLALLNKILADMGGNIKSEQDNYIAVTFTSSVFNFIDDLEIRIDKENKMIHIRSAARVGYSDFGVNRKRVEQLRHVFDKNADSLKN
jgi:uncharacterized protein (DUF1499 family)|nr:DUF1499 domain-containing protein [Deferrivibrio essentukiensis]